MLCHIQSRQTDTVGMQALHDARGKQGLRVIICALERYSYTELFYPKINETIYIVICNSINILFNVYLPTETTYIIRCMLYYV